MTSAKKSNLLDRMAGESWKQKKRAKMVRYLVRKGFDLNKLGYHGQFSKKGSPIGAPNPGAFTPRTARRPKQWPKPTQIKCVSHTPEERAAYLARVKEWKIGKFCVVMEKLHGKQESCVQCHHRNGRMGCLLMMESLWIPVSWEGHLWIHEHPDEARQHSWLCAENEWNDECVDTSKI